MAAVKNFSQFVNGYRMIDGTKLNRLFTGQEGVTNFAVNGNLRRSVVTGLTAHAGGGQANALALTADFNQINTVTTTADSVKLPPSSPGLSITVDNQGANSLQVFGTTPDTINGAATGTGVAVAATKNAVFTCFVAGAWVGPVAEA